MLDIPATLLRSRHGGTLIVNDDSASKTTEPDALMIKAVVRARKWYRQLMSQDVTTIGDIAACNGLSASFTARALRLAFLAPDIIESILDGTQPAALSIHGLLQNSADLPTRWAEQRRYLGFE